MSFDLCTLITLLVCFVLNVTAKNFKVQSCRRALNNFDEFLGICEGTWVDLRQLIRPTQPEVGYAWVQHKLDKQFSSSMKAQSEINAKVIPVVIGPVIDHDIAMYIVDGHHTLSALDYSGYDQTRVTLNVIADERHSSVDHFWSELFRRDLAYLASHPNGDHRVLPKPIAIIEMPSSFSFTEWHKTLSDDPWRSLVSFSRKVRSDSCDKESGDHKYCRRCMYRGCQDGYNVEGDCVAFFEFRWSYFMNDATYYTPTLWDNYSDYTAFKSAYNSLPHSTIGAASIEDWFYVANLVIPLCRGDGGGSYLLPNSLFPKVIPALVPPPPHIIATNHSTTATIIHTQLTGQGLPGYCHGYQKLPKDPTCAAPEYVSGNALSEGWKLFLIFWITMIVTAALLIIWECWC